MLSFTGWVTASGCGRTWIVTAEQSSLTAMPCSGRRRQPVAESGRFTKRDAEAGDEVQREAAESR